MSVARPLSTSHNSFFHKNPAPIHYVFQIDGMHKIEISGNTTACKVMIHEEDGKISTFDIKSDNMLSLQDGDGTLGIELDKHKKYLRIVLIKPNSDHPLCELVLSDGNRLPLTKAAFSPASKQHN